MRISDVSCRRAGVAAVVAAFYELSQHVLAPSHYAGRGAMYYPPVEAPDGWTWVWDCNGEPVCMVEKADASRWIELLNANLWEG